ncbi:MAG: monovalent cation/H+ antiporter subunit D family protein [Eubacteriaceae bacterium]|nr:monovalent cation/H+ antiporter subunit D family protein [Eubacteriaceae bacterium]
MSNAVDMILNLRPVLAVMVSLIASGMIMVCGSKVSPNVRESITMTACVLKAACVFSMVPAVVAGKVFDINIIQIADGINLHFRTDPLGMVFACVASGLWTVTSIYSIGYMRGHHEKNQVGYFAAFAMCLCGAVGICFAANLMTFFIFYEILTVATYPLVVHYRDNQGKKSGRKYLIYTLTSGQLFFAGIVYVYVLTGTTEFAAGGFLQGKISGGAALFLFLLMIAGGAVKAGVMPLHSWLPSAMVAPTPVSALLHAVAVVKAGAFCVIRIMAFTFGPELCKSCGASDIMAWVAAATILISSLIAIQKDNLKARLAFSTVGQLSYIVLGVSIMTPVALTGAIYHIVAHACMKITLFMCAGAIFVTTHKSEVSQMRGIGRRMPLTMTAFTVASLGIAGLPFLVGFVSKMNIMAGAYAAGKPLFAIVLIASALLSLTYLVPVAYMAFSRKSINPDFRDYNMTLKGEADWKMLAPLVITACVSVLLGVMPNFGVHLFDLAQMAAEAVFEGGMI